MKMGAQRGFIILATLVLMFVVIGCAPKTQQAQPTGPDQQEQPQPPADGSQPTPPAPPVDNTPVSAIVTATLSEWGVKLDKTTVPAGKIKFIVTNNGPKWPHALRIEGSDGKSVGDQVSANLDEVDTLEVVLKPGTYTIYCPLSGHREKGMHTKLTVT